MPNLKKGVQKIRKSYKLVKDENKAIKSLEKNSDPDIKAVLKAFKGTSAELLKKIKALKGSVTEETIQKLGLKAKDGNESINKSEDKSEDKAIKSESDGEVEIQLVNPKSVHCPDDDGKGNEVVLVVGKDGLFGCGVLKNQPTD